MPGRGANALLNSPDQLTRVVSTLVALALGVFLSRETARVVGKQVEKYLGKPRLVRETSRTSPWRWVARKVKAALWSGGDLCDVDELLRGVVLEPVIADRVSRLAVATCNAHLNGVHLRHAMFYGPPGTGKTMCAKRLARFCGLDYAIMSGGDVTALGPDAVTEIHALFKWARQSWGKGARRGALKKKMLHTVCVTHCLLPR